MDVGRFFANSFGSVGEGVSVWDLEALPVDESDSWGDARLDDVLGDLEAL
jgi:hypothetical protein